MLPEIKAPAGDAIRVELPTGLQYYSRTGNVSPTAFVGSDYVKVFREHLHHYVDYHPEFDVVILLKGKALMRYSVMYGTVVDSMQC